MGETGNRSDKEQGGELGLAGLRHWDKELGEGQGKKDCLRSLETKTESQCGEGNDWRPREDMTGIG